MNLFQKFKLLAKSLSAWVSRFTKAKAGHVLSYNSQSLRGGRLFYRHSMMIMSTGLAVVLIGVVVSVSFIWAHVIKPISSPSGSTSQTTKKASGSSGSQTSQGST